MSADNRFLILFLLGTIMIVALVGIAAYSDHQADLLKLQSPVVETCVHHRLNQKVVVQ